MPHYMFRSTYSREGLQGVLKEGAASRVEAVSQIFESLGGSLEAAYWSFGDTDFVSIGELPDNAAAAAAATTVAAAGVGTVSTTVLLTAADIDEARGRKVEFQPPGA